VILDVSGISFAYNSRSVLDEITFRVEQGQVLVILGPNGVGKTTLLRCMNGILRPQHGSVLVDAHNILSLEPTEVARRIGYVAQRTESSRLTAFDAILMGRRPHVRWKVSHHDLEVVDGAIRRLGLEKLRMRYIDRMSGGELQKVAIARALVQEPKLLLFDEPTSNLDLKNQVGILSLIRQVVRQHEVAAVMTMHDLNKALRYADTYLFLKEGTIFAAGTVAEVTAEMVEAVYGVPVEIHRYKGNILVVPLENK